MVILVFEDLAAVGAKEDADIGGQLVRGRVERLLDAPALMVGVLLVDTPLTDVDIAAQAEAFMLPVAMIGTQHIENNMKRFPWKRTHVNIVIGKPYGPIKVDPALKGRAKRQALEAYTDEMMASIAELMPVENRGPYVEGLKPIRNQNPFQAMRRKREFA